MVSSVDTANIRPRVLAFIPDGLVGAVSYVRITGPLTILQQAGYPVGYMPYVQARQAARQKAGISAFDVYIFPRAGQKDPSLTNLFNSIQSTGKKVIWETDDDYTNKYRAVIEADAIAPAKKASAITVSVPNLVQTYREITENPIFLLQNTINRIFWDMAKGKKKTKALTVGLVGTKTHYDDWILASPALHRIAKDYPHVEFVIGGYLPDYLQDLPRLKFIPPCPYQQYPHMVRQIDIGLCPLNNTDKFNHSKSAIKALEYWSAGAAVVASAGVVYDRVVQNGKTGLLCSSENDWYESIAYLIEMGVYRQTLANAGLAWTQKHRDMHKNAWMWWETYQEVYNNG